MWKCDFSIPYRNCVHRSTTFVVSYTKVRGENARVMYKITGAVNVKISNINRDAGNVLYLLLSDRYNNILYYISIERHNILTKNYYYYYYHHHHRMPLYNWQLAAHRTVVYTYYHVTVVYSKTTVRYYYNNNNISTGTKTAQ